MIFVSPTIIFQLILNKLKHLKSQKHYEEITNITFYFFPKTYQYIMKLSLINIPSDNVKKTELLGTYLTNGP